jgi:hypothetical protein
MLQEGWWNGDVEQEVEDDIEGAAKYTARTDRDFLLLTTSSKGQAKQFPGSRLVQFFAP